MSIYFAIIILIIVIIIYKLFTKESFIDYYDESPTLILYKASWCPHCISFIPVWNEFIKNSDLPIKFITADDKDDSDIMLKHGIKSFPTIRFYKNGLSSSQFVQYSEDRTPDKLKKFVEDNM